MQLRCVKRSSFVRFPLLLGPSCFLSTVFFDRRFYHCRFITIVFATTVLAAFINLLGSLFRSLLSSLSVLRQPLTRIDNATAWLRVYRLIRIVLARRITSQGHIICVDLIATGHRQQVVYPAHQGSHFSAASRHDDSCDILAYPS